MLRQLWNPEEDLGGGVGSSPVPSPGASTVLISSTAGRPIACGTSRGMEHNGIPRKIWGAVLRPLAQRLRRGGRIALTPSMPQRRVESFGTSGFQFSRCCNRETTARLNDVGLLSEGQEHQPLHPFGLGRLPDPISEVSVHAAASGPGTVWWRGRGLAARAPGPRSGLATVFPNRTPAPGP